MNALTKLALVSLLVSGVAHAAPDPSGYWLGLLDAGPVKLRVGFHVEKRPDGTFTSTMASLDQGAPSIPTDSTAFTGSAITITASKIGVRFEGKLADDAIDGTFHQAGHDFPLRLQGVAAFERAKRPQEPKPPFPYRTEDVTARSGDVTWVDDSKATNGHAAAAALAAFGPGSVVWIAGGLAKGATFDDLVASRRDRLRAVVLIGADQAPLREALDRHAPEVPVVAVDPGDTGTVMTRAVEEARLLATAAGGPVTVLLAPACASMDQFASYADRGESFAAAARALAASVG